MGCAGPPLWTTETSSMPVRGAQRFAGVVDGVSTSRIDEVVTDPQMESDPTEMW